MMAKDDSTIYSTACWRVSKDTKQINKTSEIDGCQFILQSACGGHVGCQPDMH